MAANEHSALANDQLHNPKDFGTAVNNSMLSKDGSGNLTWSASPAIQSHSFGGYHSSSGAVGNYYGKAFSADHHNFSSQVDPLDATNNAINWGMKWAHMSSEFIFPSAGTVTGWKIMYGGTASADWDFEIWKHSVADDTGANVDLVKLGATCDCTNSSSGSKFVKITDMALTGTLTFDAGDIIIVTIRKQTSGSKSIWFNSTLSVRYDI